MKLGGLDISKLYLGSNEVSKAYLGDNIVFQAGGGGVPTNGLQFYIDSTNAASYSGFGTDATDLSPNNYEFQLYNGVSFQDFQPKTFVFDGFTQYMEAYGPGPEMGTNSITINAWINKGFGGGMDATIAGRMEPGFSGSPDGSYGLMVSGSGSLQGFFKADNQPYVQTYTSSPITSGQWLLATIVFDRAGSMDIYVNGVKQILVDSGDISSYSDFSVTNMFNYYKFGAASYFGATDAYFEGSISQVIEYNRVLSEAEIQLIFNATRSYYGV